MRPKFVLFSDFYLVGMEKNLKAEKKQKGMKSPKKKTVEKNKKTKKKKIERTPRGAGRSFFGGKQGCGLICFVFLAKCIAEKK